MKNALDIQTRKIEFVQEFLKVQSEEVIARLEKILKKEIKSNEVTEFQPMSVEELNRRIDQSENDFKKGRYKSTAQLLSKY